ncbi:MAG: ABC transporter substrate-binding protein [Desulfovibrio sp.]|nr:ABC transporter substrate-binding protein [Desulfovibrio sp.]
MRLRMVCILVVLLIFPWSTWAGERTYRRVVSLYPAHAENLVAMGAGDVLVGVSEPMGSLPVVSARDGAEAIVALKPDLVLARPMHRSTHPALLQQLESMGITVACILPSTSEEIEPYWLSLGRFTGREDGAGAMVARFLQGLAEFARRVDAIPPESRKRVFFEAIHRQMKTVSPNSMAAFVLKSGGGINAAPDADPVQEFNVAHYGLERIIALGDSVDVYLAQKGPMNPVSVEEIQGTPGLKSLKAVREGRVYLVDEALVSRPTPRLLEGIHQVAAILYPEMFAMAGGN